MSEICLRYPSECEWSWIFVCWISVCKTGRRYPCVRLAVDISKQDTQSVSFTYTYSRPVSHTGCLTYKYPWLVWHTNIYGLSYIQISTASVTYRYSSQFYIQISTTIHKIHISTVSLALRILIWTRLHEIGCELQQRPHFELQDNYLYFFWYSTNFLWTNCNSLLRVGLVSIATSLSLLFLYSLCFSLRIYTLFQYRLSLISIKPAHWSCRHFLHTYEEIKQIPDDV